LDEDFRFVLLQDLGQVGMQFLVVFILQLRVVTEVECYTDGVNLLFLSMSINKVIDQRIEDTRFIDGRFEDF
jgi:hypothetical protein